MRIRKKRLQDVKFKGCAWIKGKKGSFYLLRGSPFKEYCTDMMCIVNKNIYDDGEYEGWAWIRCDKEPNEPSVHVYCIIYSTHNATLAYNLFTHIAIFLFLLINILVHAKPILYLLYNNLRIVPK
jgi:hypothetical protein